MLESDRERRERTSQRANEKFARALEREEGFLRERQKERDADAAKIARLRALRLAKEASVREIKKQQEVAERTAVEARRAARMARNVGQR